MKALEVARGAVAAASRFLPAVAREGVGLAGVALISYGAWLWSRPFGFVVGGVFLVVISVLVSKSEDKP